MNGGAFKIGDTVNWPKSAHAPGIKRAAKVLGFRMEVANQRTGALRPIADLMTEDGDTTWAFLADLSRANPDVVKRGFAERPFGASFGALADLRKVVDGRALTPEAATRMLVAIMTRMVEIDADITKSTYRGGSDAEDRPPTGDDYNELWDALLDEITTAVGV